MVLTDVDSKIINLIIPFLKQQHNQRANLTRIYSYVKQNYPNSLNNAHIKYCLLLLHIKHKVSISNRKKNKKYKTNWKTNVRLLD